MTLMECKCTQRHQKGFKSGESGKSSDVASYTKSHTLNSRGAEAGRNLWRLSHPDLKWNTPIYTFARTQNGTQTSHHYHLTKNHGGPKAFIEKEEVGIMRWDLQTSPRVLTHPRLNVLQSPCCLPRRFGSLGQEPTLPTGWVQRVESQAVSSWNTGRMSREWR